MDIDSLQISLSPSCSDGLLYRIRIARINVSTVPWSEGMRGTSLAAGDTHRIWLPFTCPSTSVRLPKEQVIPAERSGTSLTFTSSWKWKGGYKKRYIWKSNNKNAQLCSYSTDRLLNAKTWKYVFEKVRILAASWDTCYIHVIYMLYSLKKQMLKRWKKGGKSNSEVVHETTP